MIHHPPANWYEILVVNLLAFGSWLGGGAPPIAVAASAAAFVLALYRLYVDLKNNARRREMQGLPEPAYLRKLAAAMERVRNTTRPGDL